MGGSRTFSPFEVSRLTGTPGELQLLTVPPYPHTLKIPLVAWEATWREVCGGQPDQGALSQWDLGCRDITPTMETEMEMKWRMKWILGLCVGLGELLEELEFRAQVLGYGNPFKRVPYVSGDVLYKRPTKDYNDFTSAFD